LYDSLPHSTQKCLAISILKGNAVFQYLQCIITSKICCISVKYNIALHESYSNPGVAWVMVGYQQALNGIWLRLR